MPLPPQVPVINLPIVGEVRQAVVEEGVKSLYAIQDAAYDAAASPSLDSRGTPEKPPAQDPVRGPLTRSISRKEDAVASTKQNGRAEGYRLPHASKAMPSSGSGPRSPDAQAIGAALEVARTAFEAELIKAAGTAITDAAISWEQRELHRRFLPRWLTR